MNRKCKICKDAIKGRSDKIFCSIECKNYYHVRLRSVTKLATKVVDEILHRNRSILLEVMGKNTRRKKIDRTVLDKKGFKYKYITGYYINSKGKMVHYVYDFALMEFTDQGMIIMRRGS